MSRAAGMSARRPLVAIAGGGPVGLFASIQLARYGVRSVVLEKQDPPGAAGEQGGNQGDTRYHPRAHVLHPRSMELLRDIGLEARAMALVPPSEHWRKFRYCKTVLGGTEDLLAEEDHFQTAEFRMMDRVSPCRVAQLSQPRLEEILRAEQALLAHETKLTETLYRSTVVGMQECKQTNGIKLTVDHKDGNLDHVEQELVADYVIAADGAGSFLRKQLGIETIGEHDMEAFASLHFTSRKLGNVLEKRGQGAMLSFVFNNQQMGVVVSHDMRREDWVVHVPFFPPIQGFARFTQNDGAYSLQVIKECLGEDQCMDTVDDVQLRSVRAWGMHGVCAERFAGLNDRVFLVGDAAHQFPPSGGFGVNAGLADAHNLAWKLAHVVGGQSRWKNDLLASYDLERRPAIQDALSVAIDNYRRGLEPARALGLDRAAMATSVSLLAQTPGLSTSARESAVDRLLWAGKQHLHAPAALLANNVKRVVVEQGRALPLIFPRTDRGFCYHNSPALLEEIQSANNLRNDERFWLRPSFPRDHQTKWDPSSMLAGSVIPHAWLRPALDPSHRVSTVDLPRKRVGSYILLCTERSQAVQAVKSFSEMKHRVSVFATLPEGSESCADLEGVEEYRLESGRARATFLGFSVLVRPDGHIAWSKKEPSVEDFLEVLRFLDDLP